MTVQNQRPGVYSRYDMTSAYTAPLSRKYAAVVAKGTGGEPLTLYSFKSYKDACEIFSPDTDGVFMRSVISVLFESGVSEVLAVPVGDGYENALKSLESAENIGAVICDASNQEDLTALKNYVMQSSGNRRECIGFCGISAPADAIAAAYSLNCERIVLTCPETGSKTTGARSAVITAAALAGRLLASGDAAANLNGAQFPLLDGPQAFPEPDIQSMLEAGVTVFESVGGVCECIRALTTRAKTDGVPDRSLAGINSVLIIDDVMQSVRATLKVLMRGGRISGSPLESIRSQVAVVLADKQNDGLLETFDAPACYPDPSDPQVCIVEMSFKIAHVISQIHVTAHIQV